MAEVSMSTTIQSGSPRTMNLSEDVVISASSPWAHKLRSVLTLIGAVIGLAAVITAMKRQPKPGTALSEFRKIPQQHQSSPAVMLAF